MLNLTKMYGFVWTFNCDDVDTLLTKRKQKFSSGFVHLDSILCQVVAMTKTSHFKNSFILHGLNKFQ